VRFPPSLKLRRGKPTQSYPENTMKSQEEDMNPPYELDEEDQEHIRAVFDNEVVPKLAKHSARLGTLSCGFAGQEYEHWTIEFRSIGNDFEIVSFEYDEEAVGLDLDL
jgi:hypothetical protein